MNTEKLYKVYCKVTYNGSVYIEAENEEEVITKFNKLKWSDEGFVEEDLVDWEFQYIEKEDLD